MDDLESYRLAILFLCFGWGFNGFALCTGYTSRWLEVYVLGPLLLGAVLFVDSFTFDVLRGPASTAFVWLFTW